MSKILISVALLILAGCATGSVLSHNNEVDLAATEATRPPGLTKPGSEAVSERLLTLSPLSLTDVLNIALQRNPTLKSAQDKWNASKERPKQARTLEDPMVSLRRISEPNKTKTGIMLSQKFPWFGKLDLAGQVALIETNIAQQEVLNQKWYLIAHTKISYYDLFWLNQAIRINKEVKDILTNIEKIAQLQYATGKTAQSDVLKVQIELARLMNEIFTLEQMKTAVQASLNRYLNRPVMAPLGEPAPLELKPLKLSLDRLTELAMQYSPEIKTGEEEIRRNKTLVSLAGKQFYPDFTASVEYAGMTNGSTDKEWAGGVGISLPVWRGKYQSALREARENTKASENNYQALANKTAFEIKDLYVKVTTAWWVKELYEKTLIPQAEQSLATSQVAYQTGQADFLNLLDSVRILLDLKLGLYQAEVDYKKALAELEFCCAFPVENVTD